jgi:CRISPR/Cas system CSM-associated protein Csm2 small subunit
MSVPLEPLHKQSAKIAMDLSGAVKENSRSSQLISSSLDGISQSQKKIVNALAELEELPDHVQQLSNHLEKMRGAAVTLEQVRDSLEHHAREQRVLTEQDQENILEAFGQQQQDLVTLNVQLTQLKDEHILQLQERFEQSESRLVQVFQDHTQALEDKLNASALRILHIGGHLAKLKSASLTSDQVKQLLKAEADIQQRLIAQGQEQVQATLSQNLHGVAAVGSQVNQASSALNSKLQERLENVELRLGQELRALAQSQNQQLSNAFKWLVALGVLNLAGLMAGAVWILAKY